MLDSHAYLTKHGWKAGTGFKPNAISRPLPVARKRNLGGLGKDRDDGHLFHSTLFDAAAKALQIKVHVSDSEESEDDEPEETAPTPSTSYLRTSTGLISTRGTPQSGASTPPTSGMSTPAAGPSASTSAFAAAKRDVARARLYARFKQGQTWTGREAEEAEAARTGWEKGAQRVKAGTVQVQVEFARRTTLVEEGDKSRAEGKGDKEKKKKGKRDREGKSKGKGKVEVDDLWKVLAGGGEAGEGKKEKKRRKEGEKEREGKEKRRRKERKE